MIVSLLKVEEALSFLSSLKDVYLYYIFKERKGESYLLYARCLCCYGRPVDQKKIGWDLWDGCKRSCELLFVFPLKLR